MFFYILKRILIFIPTLFIISLLAFYISVSAPGDPVEILTNAASAQGGSTQMNASRAAKDSLRKQMGLDKPLFYFSMSTMADSDTLHRIHNKKHRKTLKHLTRKYGNWTQVSAYYISVQKFTALNAAFMPDSIYASHFTIKDSSVIYTFQPEEISSVINQVNNLLVTLPEIYNDEIVKFKLDTISKLYKQYTFFKPGEALLKEVKNNFSAISTRSTEWKTWVPSIRWFGTGNQYHQWIKGVIRGDFGTSYNDGKPVFDKIWDKFLLSFRLVFLSVLIAYLLSIPIGVYSAKYRGSWFDKGNSLVLFMLYSLPGFFAGTLLLYWFANPEHFVWFPESGFRDPEKFDVHWNFFQRFAHEWPYMVLPLITYTYSSMAFISRITRSSMIESLNQDYIRTARAKGLNENKVIWKHAFRNALLPIITVFVNVFPVAVGGSVIIETIFTYPGMGLASYDAVLNNDYPMLIAIFTFAGFMTMVAYFLADILYAIADPRITYVRK